jgi:hypothetical protein
MKRFAQSDDISIEARFSANSALCFEPGRTEVHREGALQRNRLPRAALKLLALLFKR